MSWQDDVKEFCDFYNIPLEYLSNTLYEPKVIPMIRGKAFEFTALTTLQSVLPTDEFAVTKEVMNAQIDSHDVDVAVKHIPTGMTLSVECKLAGKGRFRYLKSSQEYKINVKCMRSRTLGRSMVQQQAAKLNLDVDQLTTHNDSYIPSDFDVVLTSIGNVFYVTRDDGIFEWQPDTKALAFLKSIANPDEHNNLKDFAFHSLYLAHSYDLSPHLGNNIMCTRRKCTNPEACGYIPNYPDLIFQEGKRNPDHPWYSVNQATRFFRRVVDFKESLK